MIIKRTRQKISVSTQKEEYVLLNNRYPKGCPFDGYTFWDLLSDLIAMYGWRIENDREYTLSEFLDECQDGRALLYKKDFVEMERIKK